MEFLELGNGTEWKMGPDMLEERAGAACAFFKGRLMLVFDTSFSGNSVLICTLIFEQVLFMCRRGRRLIIVLPLANNMMWTCNFGRK